MPDPHPTAQANRLYWETDASVADIAEQLDISRRALYDLIEPRTTDRSCPDCGSLLVLRNRTAMHRRHAECPECEVEISLDAATADATDAGRGVEPQVEQERAAGRLSPVASGPEGPSSSGPLLGGALVMGLAVGAAATYLVRQR